MKKCATTLLGPALCVVFLAPMAKAINILSPGDFILAIDEDEPGAPVANSNHGETEGASAVFDDDFNTKYFNGGGPGAGLIVTPQFGSSTIQALQIATANDDFGRDPSSYEIYGTNEAIQTTDNGSGLLENWNLIASGAYSLGEDRFTPGPVVSFANATPYQSYKVVFPTTEGLTAGPQISELSLFEDAMGLTGDILAVDDIGLAIHYYEPPASSFPAAESPVQAIDGNVGSKYLNHGGSNAGLIVTPAVGPSVVSTLQLTTANDVPGRDPASYVLYGTNDAIASEQNSQGMGGETWVEISSGAMLLPDERGVPGPVAAFENTSSYTSYKLVFDGLKDPLSPLVQVAEVKLGSEDALVLYIDAETKEMYFEASESTTFASYTISSAAGVLASGDWQSIAATDRDPGDTWQEVSSDSGLVSEEETVGDGGVTLGPSDGAFSLGQLWNLLPAEIYGNSSPIGDITFAAFDESGQLISNTVEIVGAVNTPQLGDYDGDGDVDHDDWVEFNLGLGSQFAIGTPRGITYLGGDLDGDLDSDHFDLRMFIELAGGAGALFGDSAVPEPAAALLLTTVLACLAGGRGSRRRIGAAGAALLGLGFAASGSTALAQAVPLGTYTVVGATPITSIPANQMDENETTGPEHFFDDTLIDSDVENINYLVFDTDYNDPVVQAECPECLQYAGLNGDPKVVFMDYGSTVSANTFAYAQRSGGNPFADRVGKFEFWFSDAPFEDTLPGEAPDASLSILPSDNRLLDSVLRPYSLMGTHSGRYVAMRLTVSDVSSSQAANNIGGHEFRLLDGPEDIVLTVNRETGAMAISNDVSGASSLTVKAYQVESPSGALNPASFDGVGGDGAFPAGSGSGDGWEMGGGSNSHRLFDSYYDGSTVFAAGTGPLPLGDGYNPVSLAEDLVFTWQNDVGQVFNGRVVYTGQPQGVPGDYNDDGTVNAADYTVWRDNLDTMASLPNDTTPGQVTSADYEVWRTHYGESQVVPPVAAVPEPGALATLVMGLSVMAWRGRHTR